MESSDEVGDNGDTWNSHLSFSQRQLAGHHFRQGPILDDVLTVQIYDIRRKCEVEPVKYDTFSITSLPSGDVIAAVADRYCVSRNCVTMDTRNSEAVICEDKDLHIVFISFRAFQDSRAPASQFTDLGCIGLERGTTVSELKSLISRSDSFQTGGPVCLFARGKSLLDSEIVDVSVKQRGRVLCIDEKSVKVSCFHKPRRKTENKYTLECLNSSSVRDLKDLFKRTFSVDFPCLETGTAEIWFTQNKHVLKDGDFLFINKAGRPNLYERGRLMLHVKPLHSFPVNVKFLGNPESRDQETFALFVAPSSTTEELRTAVSDYTDHHPNSLQLVINEKKVKPDAWLSDLGLSSNCIVTVRVKNRISLNVLVKETSDLSKQSVSVLLYKLDSVFTLKKSVASKLAFDPRDLQVFFEDRELAGEKLLQNYRIKDEDTLHILHLSDSIHLRIRQPGQGTRNLTVKDFRNSTIKFVKGFLARSLEFNTARISLLHLGKYLDDDDTLFDAGLTSGDVILVPRKDKDEIKGLLHRVFVATRDNSFHTKYAVEEAGMLFYAPDSISTKDIEDRVSSYKQYTQSSAGITLSSLPVLPQSPRGSTSSTVSPQHCYKTLFGVGSSTESESSRNLQNGSPTKMADDGPTSGRKTVFPMQTGRKTVFPMQTLKIPDRSVASSALKKFTMSKELMKEGDKVILRESSFYEEDVSNDSETKSVPFTRALIQTSSECDTSDATSPQVRSFRSPSLIFPDEAVKLPVLNAVSLELGLDWRRVALALGLVHADLENLEYRYHNNLHEQALHALLLWKQRFSKRATTEKLKEALIECGLNLIADSVGDQIKYDTT